MNRKSGFSIFYKKQKKDIFKSDLGSFARSQFEALAKKNIKVPVSIFHL